MIRAIIFDCFGVLVGTGFNDTYRMAGGDAEKDKDFINDILRAASSGSIKSEDFNKQIAGKLSLSLDKWLAVAAQAETQNSDLMKMIEDLNSRYRLAILSNANLGTMQRRFTAQQLALFDEVVVSAEVNMLKPDPEIYKYTAKKLGASPEECVFIDDNSRHCQAAQDIGMKAIVYRDFSQMKRELELLLRG